jgi:hypothetical protein
MVVFFLSRHFERSGAPRPNSSVLLQSILTKETGVESIAVARGQRPLGKKLTCCRVRPPSILLQNSRSDDSRTVIPWLRAV